MNLPRAARETWEGVVYSEGFYRLPSLPSPQELARWTDSELVSAATYLQALGLSETVDLAGNPVLPPPQGAPPNVLRPFLQPESE
jgi:hypothetical protein